MMRHLFAYIALVSWPVVGAYLFYKRPLNQALIWTILGAYLLLPARIGIKIPMIPNFDKDSIPTLTALIGCILITRGISETVLSLRPR